MNKKSGLILCISLYCGTQSAFGSIVVGIDGNYFSQTITRTDNYVTESKVSATGYGIFPSARFEFSVVPLISLGIGGYFGYGSVKPAPTASVTSDTVTQIGYGGDFWLTLNLPLPVKPFGRVMVGRFTVEETTVVPTLGGNYEIVTTGSGLQYNILAGLRIPILPLIELYAQGGYAGTGNITPSLKSATLNGATATGVTIVTTNAISNGYLVGAGALLKF